MIGKLGNKVASGIKDPLGGARSVGGDVATGVKSWGKGFSDLNPFKKPNVPTPSDPRRPADVSFNRPEGLMQAQIGRTPGPVAGQIGFTPQNIQMNVPGEFRDAQSGLLSQLQAQAAGTAPSLAQMQLRQAQDANIAAQQAALASSRGDAGGRAALARQAMQQGAAIQGQTAIQGAQLRLQEQLAAQQALGQLAGQAREQDIGVAGTQAGLDMQTQQLGADLAAQQAGLTTQANIAGAQIGSAESIAQARLGQDYNNMLVQLSQLELAAAQGNQQAALEIERLRQSGELAKIEQLVQADTQQKQLIGGLLGAAGQVGAAYVARKPT